MDESTFMTVMARFRDLMTDAFERRSSYEGQAHYESMAALLRYRTAIRIEAAAAASVSEWSPDPEMDWHVQFEERSFLLSHTEMCREASANAWKKYVMAAEVSDSYSDAPA